MYLNKRFLIHHRSIVKVWQHIILKFILYIFKPTKDAGIIDDNTEKKIKFLQSIV